MTPAHDSMVGLQSIVTLTAGTLLLLLACRLPAGQRGRVAAVLLLGVLVAALALPFAGERYGRRMGDLAMYTRTREAFINYSARSAVRFEAHLSHLVVAGLDMWLGETEESPDRAFQRMSQIGAALFFAPLAAVAVWKAPAPRALRYAGLCLLVPTTLLMFGFRELERSRCRWRLSRSRCSSKGCDSGGRRSSPQARPRQAFAPRFTALVCCYFWAAHWRRWSRAGPGASGSRWDSRSSPSGLRSTSCGSSST